MEVCHSIKMKRKDGANAFWCLFGFIEQNKNEEYFYTEYAIENPRTIAVKEMPEECKQCIISLL
jgi:hypothetical protein